jgi:hypothetical protein
MTYYKKLIVSGDFKFHIGNVQKSQSTVKPVLTTTFEIKQEIIP